jgi:dinuclear metal center YbgI/SA1388 family protein
MRVKDFVEAVERIAPPRFAEPWDNAGLVIGDANREIAGTVLLTIDLTEAVLEEAIEGGFGAVLAYHPPIWEAMKRVTAAHPKERIVLRAIEAGLSVYSPHSALDAAAGGMTDWLCEGLSGGADGRIAGDCKALVPHNLAEATQRVKLVTFVPGAEAERVRDGLALCGAGMIGAYTRCSFSTIGVGTFLGDETSEPAEGEAEVFAQVDEVRLEMVCSKEALPLAVETLREFHPYEEPPLDVYELLPKPQRNMGAGRRLVLDRPATILELADRLKVHLGVPVVKVAAAGDEEASVTHVGVCPGAGAGLAGDALGAGCSVYVTGEMRHHEVLAMKQEGMSVLLAGHTNTERGYLVRLAGKLKAMLPEGAFVVSERDRAAVRTY